MQPAEQAAQRTPGAHIALVGLPGSGKSTVGRAMAEALNRRFMDFDTEIERREGRKIAEIFAAEGEDFFRKRERELTEELRASDPMILAPGGGWACSSENVGRLRPPGRMIYLRVTPETALRRMGPDVALRPLLNRQNAVSDLRRLHEHRDRFYMDADLFVDTEVVDIQTLTKMLCDYVRVVEVV